MPKDDAFADSDPLAAPADQDEAASIRAKIEARMEGRSRVNLSTTTNAYLKELLRALGFEGERQMNEYIEEGVLYAVSKHLAEEGKDLPDIPGPFQIED